MATVVTTLGEFWATTDTATYVTAAFTPSAGELLIVAAGITGVSAGTTTITCAGSTGQTFTLAGRNVRSASGHSQLVWVSNASATGISQTITITLPVVGTGAIVETFRVSGTTKRGASAVAQVAKITNGLVTAGAVTLAFTNPVTTTNPTLLLLSLNSTAPLGPNNWTIAHNKSYGTPATRNVFYTRDSGFSGTNVVWNESAATVFGVIGIEIDAASNAPINGTFSVTDTPDNLAATSYVLVKGTFAATDIQDNFASTAAVRISAGFTTVDTPDNFTAAAAVRVSGVFSVTDIPDVFDAATQVKISGAFAATDTPDTFDTTAYVIVTGTAAFTDTQDSLNATGPTSSASDTVVLVDPGAGGGSRSKRKQKPTYIRAPQDFWDSRERYLQSLQPELEKEPEPKLIQVSIPAIYTSQAIANPQLLLDYRVERSTVITAIPLATSMKELRAYGEKLRRINMNIAEQKRLRLLTQQALEAKLEKLRAEATQRRRQKRAKRIKQKRILLSTLELAKSVIRLYSSR